MILVTGLAACSNSVPTVESLTVMTPTVPATPAPASNAKNFMQLSAASQKQTLTSGYKGTVRVSQPLGRLQATSADGHKIQGTVTLQR